MVEIERDPEPADDRAHQLRLLLAPRQLVERRRERGERQQEAEIVAVVPDRLGLDPEPPEERHRRDVEKPSPPRSTPTATNGPSPSAFDPPRARRAGKERHDQRRLVEMVARDQAASRRAPAHQRSPSGSTSTRPAPWASR